MPLSEAKIRTLCTELLGVEVDDIEFPGGSSRDTIRVKIGEQGLIITHRENLQRARLESLALRFLNRNNAPVPHLIAYRDHYLIQQDVGNRRLSQSMREADNTEIATLLDAALESLRVIHTAGKNSKVSKSLVMLGHKPQWLNSLVRSAERLGAQLDLLAPILQYDKLAALLTVANPSFIKWDARPGNAIVRDNGTVIWIDWEHCGRRHPLDDLAWLLNDEYTPFIADNESTQILKILPTFAHGYSQTQAHEYLRVFGTFHSCIRLALILRYQARDGWWNFDKCLQIDSVGVVPELAMRVARRGAEWSRYSELTKDLSPWFDALQAKLADLTE